MAVRNYCWHFVIRQKHKNTYYVLLHIICWSGHTYAHLTRSSGHHDSHTEWAPMDCADTRRCWIALGPCDFTFHALYAVSVCVIIAWITVVRDLTFEFPKLLQIDRKSFRPCSVIAKRFFIYVRKSCKVYGQ